MNKTLIGIASLSALATCVSAAQPTPLNERQARPSPEWVTRGVMYQIQPRAFTPEGTLKAATTRLHELADLGVDIIYLCPVFVSDDDPNTKGWSPRQKKSGMNNPRNPYRMKDYYHVDPEYGTDDDLKAFINEAHKLRMRVLLDMVYLHCGPSAVFLAERALTHGALAWLDNDAPDSVLSYLRTFGDEQILTLVNLTGRQVRVRMATPPEGTSALRELLAQGVKEEASTDRRMVFVLEGHGFFVGKRSTWPRTA